jgi:NADH-ubiquinone oxidoreductase chain 5
MGYEMAKFRLAQELKRLSFYPPVVFMGSMWFIPFLSTYGVSSVPLQMGSSLVKGMDQGWSEKLGGQGIYESLMKASIFNQ